MFADRDVIQQVTLRWHGAARAAHDPATRLRLERYLGAIDLRPPSIPPGRVLLIRHLKLAMPDGLQPITSKSIHTQVLAAYQNAVRPAPGGFIPPEAASVIFSDYAEALAYATRAIVEGHQAWPVQHLLPAERINDAPAAQLAILWQTYIQHLPAALAQLPRRQIIRAVLLLTPSGVGQVRFALRSAFALPQATSSIDERPITPPWAAWLPGVPAAMPPAAHTLLGMALALRHAPAYARSETFASKVARWLEQTEHPFTLPPDIPTNTDHTFTDENAEAGGQPGEPTNSAPIAHEEPATDALQTHEQAPLDDTGIVTHLAGVFFLINVLNWLGFPAAWDDRLVESIGIWGWVEVIARALLPETDDDPIWGILAALDERPPEPTPELETPVAFRIPETVLERLALTHPAIDDAPDDATPLAAWLHHFMPFLRDILAQVTPEPAGILRQPGRVRVSNTHVDVLMPLERVDVRLRRAGLDHDPGWQPDYGYIILFHFEE